MEKLKHRAAEATRYHIFLNRYDESVPCGQIPDQRLIQGDYKPAVDHGSPDPFRLEQGRCLHCGMDR
jgi:hypothetical protein